ncbi:MAG: VapC toxin family PIN domain ribonuclease [Bifidobacteriaceae bacterium]|jgi:toxin-antitoxin system PIN domain toxin|nr:VapC toxin family PIN domain ribonuclease [Bifidobacteriaceae bacterium]
MTAPTYLLDANVLIPLADLGNIDHQAANTWLGTTKRFATCPITEGALVRHVVRMGGRGQDAARLVGAIRSMAHATFWPDDVSYADVLLDDVYGHRQVTDSYLIALVRRHPGARLATFDRALGLRAPDIVELPELPEK